MTKSPNVFCPTLRIHYQSRVPHPILPVDYTSLLQVKLPETISSDLATRLAIARDAAKRKKERQLSYPFGRIEGYEFRPAPRVSIYLNSEGDFAPWLEEPDPCLPPLDGGSG